MKLLEIDNDRVHRLLVAFIREHTERQGFARVVLGLSGGLDSTFAAHLAVEALGPKDCIGVFMPHAVSDPGNLRDAQEITAYLGMPTQLVDITPMVRAFQNAFPQATQVQLGNLMARCRMMVLFHISAVENALVMGTSNKSEILLGYGTLHGDLACAFNPLGDLYKTQIRSLAAHSGVPEKIRQKIPSADLWSGQSDEGELGFTYAEADQILVRWIDHHYSRRKLRAEGFAPDLVDRIMRRVKNQRFKGKMPPIAKVSAAT